MKSFATSSASASLKQPTTERQNLTTCEHGAEERVQYSGGAEQAHTLFVQKQQQGSHENRFLTSVTSQCQGFRAYIRFKGCGIYMIEVCISSDFWPPNSLTIKYPSMPGSREGGDENLWHANKSNQQIPAALLLSCFQTTCSPLSLVCASYMYTHTCIRNELSKSVNIPPERWPSKQASSWCKAVPSGSPTTLRHLVGIIRNIADSDGGHILRHP